MSTPEQERIATEALIALALHPRNAIITAKLNEMMARSWPYSDAKKECRSCGKIYFGATNVGSGQCRVCWVEAGGDEDCIKENP